MCNECCYRVIDTRMQKSCVSYSDGLTWFLTFCDGDLLISCSYFLQEDSDPAVHESLSIENTLWASTVVASGKCCNAELLMYINTSMEVHPYFSKAIYVPHCKILLSSRLLNCCFFAFPLVSSHYSTYFHTFLILPNRFGSF